MYSCYELTQPDNSISLQRLALGLSASISLAPRLKNFPDIGLSLIGQFYSTFGETRMTFENRNSDTFTQHVQIVSLLPHD